MAFVHQKAIIYSFSIKAMVFQAALPKTPKELDEYIAFLCNNIFLSYITLKNQWAFRCKLSLWEFKNNLLYLCTTNDKPAKQFIPEWDSDARTSLFQQFYDDDCHIDYKKTFTKISTLHISITK